MQVYASEIGGRERNEDAFRVGDGAYVVCDGVGGGPYGYVASELAAEFWWRTLRALPAAPRKADFDALVALFGRHLADVVEAHPELTGMATTVVFAHHFERTLTVGWCGDSRAYLIRECRVAFRTGDHNWAAALVKAGILSEDEARHDFRRNALLHAAVYSHRPVHFDFAQLSTEPGDVLVLASDGAYQPFTESQWAEIWSNHSLEAAALIVKQKGFEMCDDNYTFCAVKLP
ncbi:MAG: protein phosphatase 2C domain-containing protein [Bacteroidia bacterium]|nr:protein phosphatase 2C domain-containing protein [Bacteroidia bacterium]